MNKIKKMNGKHQQHNWSSRENNLWTWRQVNWKYTIREEKIKRNKESLWHLCNNTNKGKCIGYWWSRGRRDQSIGSLFKEKTKTFQTRPKM